MNNDPSELFSGVFDNWEFTHKKKYEKNITFEETDEHKLDSIDMSVIESYVRKKKLENINKK